MNRLFWGTGIAASLLVLISPALAGDVSGHAIVTRRLTKTVVPSAIYNLRGAPPPAGDAAAAPVNEFDRMVVILERDGGEAGKHALKPPETVVIDQRNRHFEPDLVVIPVGSSVQFPNADPIFHNVFSLSRAQSFDLGFYPRGESRTVKFHREGIVQVYCHIHPNMYAAIVVTASPWYARPSADGSFSWKNVPAGHYRLTAWHKIAGLHQVKVEVPQTGSAEVSIRVPVDVEQRPSAAAR